MFKFQHDSFNQVKFALPSRPKPIIILLEELSPADLSSAPDFGVLMKGKGSFVLHWNEAGFWNKLRFYLPDPKVCNKASRYLKGGRLAPKRKFLY